MDCKLEDITDPSDFPVDHLKKLDSSLRCPICKDFFDGPVILHCGHTFCSLVSQSYATTKSIARDGRDLLSYSVLGLFYQVNLNAQRVESLRPKHTWFAIRCSVRPSVHGRMPGELDKLFGFYVILDCQPSYIDHWYSNTRQTLLNQL
jgi:hypothetical protein